MILATTETIQGKELETPDQMEVSNECCATDYSSIDA